MPEASMTKTAHRDKAVGTTVPKSRWRVKLRRVIDFLGPIFILLLFWEAIARFEWLNPVLFPPPSLVVRTIVDLLSSVGHYVLWNHIALSLYRLFAGFLSAAVIGVVVGTGMGLFDPVYRFFAPILSIIIPIPSIAWVPIVILWLGLGNATPIFIVFLSAIFPVLYNTSTGVRSINKKHVWAAQIMGANKTQIFLGVVLPSALAYIITGLKLALATAWRSLVGAEMLSATAWGLGYMIFEAKEFLQIEVMYGGIVCLAVLGFILENSIFGTIETRTLKRWGMLKDI